VLVIWGYVLRYVGKLSSKTMRATQILYFTVSKQALRSKLNSVPLFTPIWWKHRNPFNDNPASTETGYLLSVDRYFDFSILKCFIFILSSFLVLMFRKEVDVHPDSLLRHFVERSSDVGHNLNYQWSWSVHWLSYSLAWATNAVSCAVCSISLKMMCCSLRQRSFPRLPLRVTRFIRLLIVQFSDAPTPAKAAHEVYTSYMIGTTIQDS